MQQAGAKSITTDLSGKAGKSNKTIRAGRLLGSLR
jgi:hypothetical protein